MPFNKKPFFLSQVVIYEKVTQQSSQATYNYCLT